MDTDGDGVADVADCAFADAGAWAAPDAVSGLQVDRGPGETLVISWASQDGGTGPSTSYDLVHGMIAELKDDTDFHRAGCLASGLADSPLEVSITLAPGESEYFLLRAHNSCGAGGYGHASASDPRFALAGDVPCSLP